MIASPILFNAKKLGNFTWFTNFQGSNLQGPQWLVLLPALKIFNPNCVQISFLFKKNQVFLKLLIKIICLDNSHFQIQLYNSYIFMTVLTEVKPTSSSDQKITSWITIASPQRLH